MEELIDPEILMMFGIFVMSFVLLNLLFKFISMPNIIKKILIIGFVVGMIFMVMSYIDKHEVSMTSEETSSNRVVGRVDIVSTTINKIQITYQKSNILKSNISDEFSVLVNVKISSKTKVYRVKNGVKTKISIDEIAVGDTVTVYCKESKLDDKSPTITPVKIYVYE